MRHPHGQIDLATHDDSSEMYRIRDTLEHLEVSQEEIDYYSSEFEAGRSILLIRPEGRRIEALNILFLNGTRSHKYLDVGSQSSDDPTPATGESNRQVEASQNSSPGSRLNAPSKPDALATEQDEIESVRRLLKSADLDHLL